MNKKPFKNLNLFTIKYPLTAITSLLHRISGIFVYLLIPLFLWLLAGAVSSETGFSNIQNVIMMPIVKFTLWLCLAAFGYHLIAGIRHILMDLGLGETLQTARVTAVITIGISIIWAILIGIWLW